MIFLTNKYLEKLINITLDTCNLQCAIRNILADNSKLKHVLFIFSDFYSLQLPIKNIFKLLSIAKVFQNALKIVNTLKKAEHFFNILCSY